MLHKPEGSSSSMNSWTPACPVMRHHGKQQRREEGVCLFAWLKCPRYTPLQGAKTGAQSMQEPGGRSHAEAHWLAPMYMLYICYIWVHMEVKRQLVGVSACLLSSGVPRVP